MLKIAKIVLTPLFSTFTFSSLTDNSFALYFLWYLCRRSLLVFINKAHTFFFYIPGAPQHSILYSIYGNHRTNKKKIP